MENEKELFRDWKLLRYSELPNFEIYSDQLIAITERELAPFLIIGNYQNTTKSMINNYVKANIMSKPTKKKYNKDQLVVLIIISMLKTVFSINEIDIGIKKFTVNKNYEEVYDRFCDLMENSLRELFLDEDCKKTNSNDLIEIACRSVASKLYVQYMLNKEVLE